MCDRKTVPAFQFVSITFKEGRNVTFPLAAPRHDRRAQCKCGTVTDGSLGIWNFAFSLHLDSSFIIRDAKTLNSAWFAPHE